MIGLDLFISLLPLYSIIFFGFLAAKYLQVNRASIAPLLIYIVNPIVFFFGLLHYEINAYSLLLTLAVFVLSLFAALIYLRLGGYFWKDYRKNILALIAGTGNTGYFGLPLAMIIFGDQILGVTVLTMLGRTIFEQSIGFFISANGRYSIAESLRQTAQVPTVYAAALAITIKLLHIDLSGNLFFDSFAKLSDKFTGTYSVLGMLMIGLGLAQLHTLKFNRELLNFIALSFSACFFVSPLLSLGLILLDLNYWHLWSQEIYKVLILISVVPIASNTITFATKFDYDIEAISFTVLLSTLFAVFYIPWIVTLFRFL